MAYLSDRMRLLAATGCPQAAELLEKADDLDEALAKDPSDVTTARFDSPTAAVQENGTEFSASGNSSIF
jgi:hypothetical protein